jgi:alanine racemase
VARVDLGALADNCRSMQDLVAPAEVCAVVKANAYGHGAPQVATTARQAGVRWLAVALIEEAMELLAAGLEPPILVLSEIPRSATEAAVRAGISLTVYSRPALHSVREVAAQIGRPARVHLKVDTGMHRVGADLVTALALAQEIGGDDHLVLEGVCTHLAVADDPSHPGSDRQLASFAVFLSELADRGLDPGLVHAANSSGAIWRPDSRYSMVRCGISLYGYVEPEVLRRAPSPVVLQPVMSWVSQVVLTRDLEAGEAVSYGLRRPRPQAGQVAVVPVGYADGFPRRMFEAGGQVLIRGIRRHLAGTVTMDQIVVDCGLDRVEVGDEVILIGRDDGESILADEVAHRLGTISYEVLCGIGARVPRLAVGREPRPGPNASPRVDR